MLIPVDLLCIQVSKSLQAMLYAVPSAQTAWHWSIEDKLRVRSHTMAQRGPLAGELFLVRYSTPRALHHLHSVPGGTAAQSQSCPS